MAGPNVRAQGPSHSAGAEPRAGLGQGVDPGRREPGRQRLLVRLRRAAAAAGRSIVGRRPAGRRGRCSWPRRSRPTRRSSARRRSSRAEQAGGRRVGEGRAPALAGAAARGRRGQAGPGVRRPRRPGRSSSRRGARRRPSSSASAGRAGSTSRRTSPVESWRGDQDLLANTQSGAALPVGQLQVRRYCGLAGEFTPLATLRGGEPLLARVPTNRGGVYFCATTPAAGDSSLATERRRPLRAGPAGAGRRAPRSSGSTRQLDRRRAAAGEDPDAVEAAGGGRRGALDRLRRFIAGVYRAGERLLAVNRAGAGGSGRRSLADDRVAELVPGPRFRPRRRPGGQHRLA